MIHVFVPLDIGPNLDHHYIDQDKLAECFEHKVVGPNEFLHKDVFNFLSTFALTQDGDYNNEKQFLISPFKAYLTDIDLLDNLELKLKNTFGGDIVIHLTFSEHTAIVMDREFWFKTLPNFNVVISDVWEPKFLHVSDNLSMTNVLDYIKECEVPEAPFYQSLIKPNASPKMNKWLNISGLPNTSFYNFDYFIFDTWNQSGVVSESSRYETNDIHDIDLYLELVFSANKIKDFVCLNRSYKYHRPKIINDLWEAGILNRSYFSLAEIVTQDEEEYTVVKDLGMPILSKGEPEHNIRRGRMSHDSVANIDWAKNSKLFISTESQMYECTDTLPGYSQYEMLFVSEKVHKPLAWAMPFIVLGPCRSLAHMKQLGFKTFEPYIDESYDLIDEPEARYQAVLSSIKKFIAGPYPKKELEEIAEYNLRLFYSKKLYQDMVNQLVLQITHDYVTKRERDDFEFRKIQ
jgi:hypothetical protein|tara:strand:- start:24 stop:1406 length:1383 start_codon:yes stop_codon:yes gene_type:complete